MFSYGKADKEKERQRNAIWSSMRKAIAYKNRKKVFSTKPGAYQKTWQRGIGKASGHGRGSTTGIGGNALKGVPRSQATGAGRSLPMSGSLNGPGRRFTTGRHEI